MSFYHVQIHHKHNVDEYKVNLTEEQLLTRIVEPYTSGQPIVLNGRTIELNLINRINIFKTEDNLDNAIKEFEEERRTDPSPYKIFDAAPEWKAIETGKNVTDDYITEPPGNKKVNVFIEKRAQRMANRLETVPVKQSSPDKEKVFVVHGHDNALKDETCVFLTGLGFEPIVLHRQPDGGLTIIEKFEKNADVKYAFVLLTPDDYGFKADELKKPENERVGEFRARQNVIFELGYFIGKLGRQFVCCIYKNVTVPSDISGLIYKNVNKSIEEVGYEIIKELKNAGLHPKV